MPTIVRVYTGDDGQSHLEEVPLSLQPFVDTEGAYGEGTPLQQATGITFRVAPPGYVLQWHCAPRRQYTITLSGEAEIEVGDGTVKHSRPGGCAARGRFDGPGPHHAGRGEPATVVRGRALGLSTDVSGVHWPSASWYVRGQWDRRTTPTYNHGGSDGANPHLY